MRRGHGRGRGRWGWRGRAEEIKIKVRVVLARKLPSGPATTSGHASVSFDRCVRALRRARRGVR